MEKIAVACKLTCELLDKDIEEFEIWKIKISKTKDPFRKIPAVYTS